MTDKSGTAQGLRRVGAVTLFIVLLACVQLAGPHGSLSILWRLTVLSFDNPATQVLDELALVKTPYTDRRAELIGLARLAATSSRRMLPLAPDGFAPGSALPGDVARSPPLA